MSRSLTEIMLVILITGLLMAGGYKGYKYFVSKAKATEAQEHLNMLYTLEQNYFYMNSEYSAELKAIGYEKEKLSTEGGTANYLLEVTEAASNKFKARATAIKDFDGDGQFNVWEIDQDKTLKEVTED